MEEKSSKGKGEATHRKEENQVSLKSSLQGQNVADKPRVRNI